MKQSGKNTAITYKTLNKNNVWDLQEDDVFKILDGIENNADISDDIRRFTDIVRTAFTIEEIHDDSPVVKSKYEKLGYKVKQVRLEENTKLIWAVKKRPIMRITDLTYENIHHISAAKLIEVLDRNFGGGWDSLSQSIKDIIESGFDISTTTLPKDRLHKPGGTYEKKVSDGYEVLEISKGSWAEAIFAKAKPEMEKPRLTLQNNESNDLKDEKDAFDDIDDDNEMSDNDEFNEDDITEDTYRTTFDIDGEPDEIVDNISDFTPDD